MDTKKLNRTSRPIGVRLEPSDIEFARIGGRSVTSGIIFTMSVMKAIYAEALNELHGYFSVDEWHFLQIVMEGEHPREANEIISKDNLCRIILKPKNIGASKLTGVVPHELAQKVQNELTAAHVYAIWERVLDFHDHKKEMGAEVFDWLSY